MAITQYSSKGLTKWPELKSSCTDLRINSNSIEHIPDEIEKLEKLTVLLANKNKISKISEKIKSLKKLVSLQLSNNRLNIIPPIIWEIRSLETLVLSGNRISEIPKGIAQLSSLEKLHLSNNNLVELDFEIGDLSNLKELNISNNPITRLPSSLKKLTKLRELDLRGTKLPLPPGYKFNSDVQSTIDFVLKNQETPIYEISIVGASIFYNFSLPQLTEAYKTAFNDISQRLRIEVIQVKTLTDLVKKTSMLLLVVGFDINENENLFFDLIRKCTENKIRFKILFKKEIKSISEVNLIKGESIEEFRSRVENDFIDHIFYFDTKRELQDLVINILKEHKPEVVLKSLEISNIGHFNDVSIKFDRNLTCIIGENGLGKSSVLRALALSIVGQEYNKVDSKVFKRMLRINSVNSDGILEYCHSGKIRLVYYVDSVECQNIITLESKDNGRIIDVSLEGSFLLNSGEFNLISLIIGFPQLRGRMNLKGQSEKNKYFRPHLDDLIPLIVDSDDNRLDSFVSWIANLYGNAIKEGDYEGSKEQEIINNVFMIISEITDKNISFITVQKFSPPLVIVSTSELSKGVPVDLISQGFKVIIGWVGYFIQRRIEAYPLKTLQDSFRQKGILIIDEIDSSIHPIWQKRLLDVIKIHFPNTQFICSTHSPLMVANLKREQIQEIKNVGNRITVENSKLDTWITSYQEILNEIFDTPNFEPKFTKEDILNQLKDIDPDSEQAIRLNETLYRILENEKLLNSNAKLEGLLKEKEKELDLLIKEYKKS